MDQSHGKARLAIQLLPILHHLIEGWSNKMPHSLAKCSGKQTNQVAVSTCFSDDSIAMLFPVRHCQNAGQEKACQQVRLGLADRTSSSTHLSGGCAHKEGAGRAAAAGAGAGQARIRAARGVPLPAESASGGRSSVAGLSRVVLVRATECAARGRAAVAGLAWGLLVGRTESVAGGRAAVVCRVARACASLGCLVRHAAVARLSRVLLGLLLPARENVSRL